MQPQIRPALVTETEARRYLGGVARSTIYKLRAEGTLPVVHLGRAVRFRIADLDAAIESLTAQSSVQAS